MDKTNKIKLTAKIVVIIFLLIMVYLYVLNGRYIKDDKIVFDKWKKEAYIIGSEEMPLIYNGE